MNTKKEISIPMAILMNTFIPGLGYLYIGRVRSGIVIFFGLGLLYLITFTTIVFFMPVFFISQFVLALEIIKLGKIRNSEASKDLKACGFCAELILKEAKVCKHCGRDLPQASAS